MEKPTFWTHTIDLLKGVAAAAIVGALMSGLEYLGAHLPALIEMLGPGGGAIAVIKATRLRG